MNRIGDIWQQQMTGFCIIILLSLLTKKESNVIEKKDMMELVLEDDVKKVLLITDELLGKLPEEVINEFAQSDDFELYKKVMGKYKIK